MKLNGGTLFLVFIWCLFMGVTAISIGFGALFPSMNRIAKPFVCPGGQMEVETQTYNPSPGTTITTLTWYCVKTSSGTKKELGIFPMALYAGLIYGFILFIVVFLFMWLRSNRSPEVEPQKSSTRLAEANAYLEDAKQFRAQAEQFRERAEQFRDSTSIFGQTTEAESASHDALERMKELKKLRDANLISETEYEEKRKEILKKL